MKRFNDYEAVAASQSDQVLGEAGTQGDVLDRVVIVPATTSPGAVSIKDGSGGSAITIFTGGAASVADLTPIVVELSLIAVDDWRLTTGANVSAIAVGKLR